MDAVKDEEEAATSASLAGRKVLLVDDDPYLISIVGFKLRMKGMTPIEAYDAESALEAAESAQPDVILLDVSLTPGPSGFELCQMLKANPKTAHIPVLMLTGHNHEEERVLGLSLGARAYLTKPFSTKVLMHEIESALGA
jgi:DNA-binding response OmpR family regulator